MTHACTRGSDFPDAILLDRVQTWGRGLFTRRYTFIRLHDGYLTIPVHCIHTTIGNHRLRPRPNLCSCPALEEIVLLDSIVNDSLFQTLPAHPSIREPDHSQPHRGPLCRLRQNEMIIDLALALGLSWRYLASWFSHSNPCGRPIALASTLHRKQGHASKTKIDGIRNLWG